MRFKACQSCRDDVCVGPFHSCTLFVIVAIITCMHYFKPYYHHYIPTYHLTLYMTFAILTTWIASLYPLLKNNAKHMSHVHVSKQCMIQNKVVGPKYGEQCQNEATRWLAVDCTPNRTFYLCADHADHMSGGTDSDVIFFNPATSSYSVEELAVYSCSPDCRTCNE